MAGHRSSLCCGVALMAALLLVALAAGACGTSAQDTPRSGYVTTPDGVRIHYLEAGTRGAAAPAILFIPGWTMPAWIWERQIAHFSKTHRVVAMDPRSQGESDKPADGHYPAARARDIKAVVDQLKLAPVVLAGWSMGVQEVVAYVDQFGTGSLAGVVLVDGIAGGAFNPETSPVLLNWVGSFQRDRAAQTAAFVRNMYRTPQSEDYLARVAGAAMKTPTASAVALFVGSFTSDMRAALPGINKPALVIYAPGSPWEAAYVELHKAIPGSRLERFDGAGHALFVDAAPRFNALLGEFLAGLR